MFWVRTQEERLSPRLLFVPQEWDALIAEPDVLLLDTRNSFESSLGTFDTAEVPPLGKFSEFSGWCSRELLPRRAAGKRHEGGGTAQEGKGEGQEEEEGGEVRGHRRVAMFCTGGIRCEKASAWLLQHGGCVSQASAQPAAG